MSQHTPEPWDYVTGRTGLHHVETHIDNPHGAGRSVCSIPKSREADAARIVDCVNTLAGFQDLTKVKALLDAIRAEASSYHDDSTSHELHTKNCDRTESQLLQLVVSLGPTDKGVSGDTQTGP